MADNYRVSINTNRQEVVRVTQAGGGSGSMDYPYVNAAVTGANSYTDAQVAILSSDIANTENIAIAAFGVANSGGGSMDYPYVNTAVAGANSYMLSTVSGANTEVGAGANAYTNTQVTALSSDISNTTNIAVAAFAQANTGSMDYPYVNTAVAGANSYMLSTVAGANTAVGAGANAYADTVGTAAGTGANTYATAAAAGANNYLLATVAGANTAVGAGANAYADSVGAGANNYLLTVISGANTAVGAGANNYLLTVIAGANTAVGAGANAYADTKVSSVSGTAGEIYSSSGTTPTLNLIATGVTADIYGGATQIPVITVDALGRITTAANVSVQGMDYAYVNTATQASNTYADSVGAGANAYATAVGTAGNTYFLATIAGANTAVGAGANAYATAVGTAGNTYLLATIAGANTAVGAGANAYADSIVSTAGSAANAFTSATISGANTAVGAGANAYATAVGTAGNTYLLATIAGANTAVGAGANAYAAAATTGANNFLLATIGGSNTIAIAAFDKANSITPTGVDTAVEYNWTNNHSFSMNVSVYGIKANGTLGTSGQVLTSNGTIAYWADPTGGPGGSVGPTYTKYQYLSADSQTVFDATYDVGYVDVWVNGSKLANTDFTATDETTITLSVGATQNDVVDIIAWNAVNVSVLNFSSGSVVYGLVNKSNGYNINANTDYCINCQSNTFPVTLPTASGIIGQQFIIKNSNTPLSGNTINVITTSSQTIDSETNVILFPRSALTVMSDGNNWIIV